MKHINYDDGEVKIRASIRSDIDYLKDHLRDEDLRELKLAGVESIEDALLFGLAAPKSICYTMEFKGTIVAMFGCVPVEFENVATLWMLSTEDVKKFKYKFIKLAKQYVEGFKKEYGTLFNLIHRSNKMSMKLVKILKAEFSEGYESPKTNEPFTLFLI